MLLLDGTIVTPRGRKLESTEERGVPNDELDLAEELAQLNDEFFPDGESLGEYMDGLFDEHEEVLVDVFATDLEE